MPDCSLLMQTEDADITMSLTVVIEMRLGRCDTTILLCGLPCALFQRLMYADQCSLVLPA
jgi:hypothetical protein